MQKREIIIYITTKKPDIAINQLIHTKMAQINKINSEALILSTKTDSCSIKKLLELQKELKALSSDMMPHIKNSLISRILKERSQYL